MLSMKRIKLMAYLLLTYLYVLGLLIPQNVLFRNLKHIYYSDSDNTKIMRRKNIYFLCDAQFQVTKIA
jgi:hypothetical protein